ncbi:sulfotransferase [Phenylobacterium sp.]|jgi:tetratricopeptide (TPR) repeat protein|uniref:sulfotransferase n=1 Tax=Phenylobacterium sp. TaxID=1871053 RepID=UPI002E2F133A|nr:sulfotransferase [Phenylobacterium sp.]HEX4709454.1 sulfotransferase [Phenylobacterium sp.]
MSPGSLTDAIEQASAVLATDAAAAERLARGVLAAAPGDPRPALILGSALRRQGDFAAAHAILAPLAQAYPRAARTQYELGMTLAGLADPAAVDALRRAVAANGDLAEGWKALGDQLFRAGDAAGAEAAFKAHMRAAVRDPALAGAADALFADDPVLAERLLRAHLDGRPDDTAARQMLAQACVQLGRQDEAQILLAACLQADPGRDGARFQLAEVLFHQQQAAEAIPHIKALLARDPEDPAYRNLLAACLGMVGDYAPAIEIYDRLLADYPKHPRIWLNYGHALRTVGRRDEAVAAYRQCIALAPGLGDAYWSLANLKTASATTGLEAAMRSQLVRADLADDDRLHLHYALGRTLEDHGDAAGAFEQYAAGAALRRKDLRYDADETSALTRRSIALFTPAFFEARAGAGSPSDAPIFIVGLPRSGSTLVEQILASHSLVEGTMELPDIALIARGLLRPGPGAPPAPYPDVLAGLDAGQLSALGETYLERTCIQRKSGRPFFVDKMPNNFHHLGLIRLILPRARIIDARRHPLGSGFSAFKQHFAHGHAFSYDLTDLGRYYRDYVALMAHFDAVLPGRIHRVIYEDLVEDTEREVLRLLDYCGLPFEPGCLKFYENARAVRTVSSEQVRRPIFREGLEQWRSYEPWLDPLKTALGPALKGWRSGGS